MSNPKNPQITKSSNYSYPPNIQILKILISLKSANQIFKSPKTQNPQITKSSNPEIFTLLKLSKSQILKFFKSAKSPNPQNPQNTNSSKQNHQILNSQTPSKFAIQIFKSLNHQILKIRKYPDLQNSKSAKSSNFHNPQIKIFKTPNQQLIKLFKSPNLQARQKSQILKSLNPQNTENAKSSNFSKRQILTTSIR